MAIYVVGDIHGCRLQLEQLLEKLAFTSSDQLWLVGDLINRGPDSLGVMRLLLSLKNQVHCVLGNHDLALLVAAEGFMQPHKKDTWHKILQAPERDEILAWFRSKPLILQEPHSQAVIVHAGLCPQWNLPLAFRLAQEVSEQLQANETIYRQFLRELFGNQPSKWHEELQGIDRLRCTVNYCTRMRLLQSDGSLNFNYKGVLQGAKSLGLTPWFETPRPAHNGLRILFGHWAALGYYRGSDVVALDSGCAWNGKLTALQLDAPDWPIVQI